MYVLPIPYYCVYVCIAVNDHYLCKMSIWCILIQIRGVIGGKFKIIFVKVNGYFFRGSNSAIFLFASLINKDQLLKKRICSLGANSFL